MVFSSVIFLFSFLPILLLIYFFSADKYKNGVLLIASLLFYAWGEPKNIFIMVISICFNYTMAFFLRPECKYKKFFLIVAVSYNLVVLFIFKYLNFAVNTIDVFFDKNIKISMIALPIGISFYTFQIISYIVDVYRGDVKVQKNIINLGLYVSLFPQLIAGPIVRYTDIEKQIKSRIMTWEETREGVLRFCKGFSKKILIADQLSILVDVSFGGAYPSIYLNWIGMIAYTLQIFFDFSGYSDMAIGLGKVFGFNFVENFNYPYISQSIQEFWRRWHISLSSWFRDYVYIPLGGSRAGKIRTYINLIIVFFLTGLWHGASFNFIVWGLFYAFFLILERLGGDALIKKMPRIIRHIYVLLVIMIGWVFFRAEDLNSAISYIRGLIRVTGKQDIPNFLFVMNKQYWFIMLIGVLLCVPHIRIEEWFSRDDIHILISDIVILIIFIIALCYMIGSGYSPFLYFRF